MKSKKLNCSKQRKPQTLTGNTVICEHVQSTADSLDITGTTTW